MRIYVAASSKEIDRVRAVYARLRAAGHTITRDWTEVIVSAPGPDESLSDEVAGRAAQGDIDGVIDADALLFLVPRRETHGAWIELGVGVGLAAERVRAGHDATAEPPRIVAAGPRTSIFLAIDGVERFDTDEDALIALGCTAG